MSIHLFARIFGAVFLIVGIAGFIPGITQPHDHPGLAVKAASGMELGLFPVNVVHNLVHLAFGVWGLLAGRTLAGAAAYCRIAGIAYIALAAIGLLAPAGFGLVPLGGHDVWLHAILGIILTAVAFVDRARPATVHL